MDKIMGEIHFPTKLMIHVKHAFSLIRSAMSPAASSKIIIAVMRSAKRMNRPMRFVMEVAVEMGVV